MLPHRIGTGDVLITVQQPHKNQMSTKTEISVSLEELTIPATVHSGANQHSVDIIDNEILEIFCYYFPVRLNNSSL
jgi:hypothetical protein